MNQESITPNWELNRKSSEAITLNIGGASAGTKKAEPKKAEEPKKEEPKEVTSNDLKRQDNIDKLFERQEKRLAELKQDFKDEIFTKEEYLERIKSIEEQTNLALSKFGEGGKV